VRVAQPEAVVFMAADAALYCAKREGRGRVVVAEIEIPIIGNKRWD